MAKSTKEPKSTVVLNDNVNTTTPVDTTPVDTQENKEETTTPSNTENCDKHNTDECTCKPGHCPKKECANYWSTATKGDKYVYHYDSDDESVKLEDADHRKANPIYEVPKDPTPTPSDPKQDTPNTPSSDNCPNDLEEPWAHDKLMEADAEHTSLEKELKFHTGSNWSIIESWINQLTEETDPAKKEELIAHIAWHIPTGGNDAIKVHHKEKIVAELKKL